MDGRWSSRSCGGGVTALRVDTYFLLVPDRRAAEQLARQLGSPRLPGSGQPDASAAGWLVRVYSRRRFDSSVRLSRAPGPQSAP